MWTGKLRIGTNPLMGIWFPQGGILYIFLIETLISKMMGGQPEAELPLVQRGKPPLVPRSVGAHLSNF